jgi:hypothetical protein
MTLKIYVGCDPREDITSEVYLHSILRRTDPSKVEVHPLTKGWNCLEGWYAPHYDKLKAVHYTLGGRWFEHKMKCDFADLWLEKQADLKMHATKRAEA